MMKLFVLFATFALFTMHVSGCGERSASDDIQSQRFSFPSITENLTFEDIDRLVDQLLEKSKESNTDTSSFANDLLILIYQNRENDKRRISITLLRMYQYNNVESSESVTRMLNELFYFEPQVVVSALADIGNHLLEENRNTKFIDYLIHSACGIPQIVTESFYFGEGVIRKDANRIISEIRALNVNSALKSKIIDIVESWM